MCTQANPEATKKFIKAIKPGKKGHAWKIVNTYWANKLCGAYISSFEYNKDGENVAYRTDYNQGYAEKSIEVFPFPATELEKYKSGDFVILGGTFHAFRTRKIARIARAHMKDCSPFLALKKIEFHKEDVFAVGNSASGDKETWGIKGFDNDSVCITKFKFTKGR